MFQGWNGPANVNQAVAVISLDSAKVEIAFIAGFLNSQRGQEILLGNRVEGARANISLTDLRELDIVLPPLERQHEYACRVEAVARLKASHRAHLAELDALFASLQYRAFRGEL
ncbi:MAG: restriction endonuclease subunit S [Candidatus Dormibacteraceae bacterium]